MQGIDCKFGDVTLSIDVSDMTDADSAYGMFAANRDLNKPVAKSAWAASFFRRAFCSPKANTLSRCRD